ncbi:MASE4 domain-containing protein [Klebsiella quasipneumoniae]|uniref:MASE4 domain-containing protein n=1 Tax=Klebsiella quasipneumoniae TaxID=1463165 RepID=UPI003BF65F2D
MLLSDNSFWDRFLASNIMVYMWTLLFFTTIALTRFRNIFWTGIYFYCFVYILTFSFLTTADVASENTWYKARLFETLGTLIFIIIIFLNAFKLYQLSNNKYENAYQNSIHDYLTQLYNRRYFLPCADKKNATGLCAKTIVYLVMRHRSFQTHK